MATSRLSRWLIAPFRQNRAGSLRPRLGGSEPTFADITLCTAIAFSKYEVCATPLDERYEQLDRYWQAWKAQPAFRSAYADGVGWRS